MAEPARGERGTWRWLGLWDGDQLDTAATLRALPVDDLTASALITAERPGEILHKPDARNGVWFIYDGTHHKPDRTSDIATLIAQYAARAQRFTDYARGVVATRSDDAMRLANPQVTETQLEQARKRAWEPWSVAEKYHTGLRRSAGLNSLIGYLKGAPGVGVSDADLADRWPHYLNTPSGVVHQLSGTVYPHSPAWGFTYCLDVPYDPAATCQRFNQMFLRACGGNQNIAVYLWKVLGYAALGGNPEQKIFILCGDTASGKSQVLDAVSIVIRALAHSSPVDLISVGKRHPRVEASITGKRLVTITETSGHSIIDEAQVKRLTGEREMSISPLYATAESMVPVTATIIQATNEMQTLTNFDPAMQRRVVAIPMGEAVPEDERVLRLGEQIAASEGPGILAWLVAGSRAYAADGHLKPPAEVSTYTANYQNEQNTLSEFVADWCRILGPSEQAMWNGQGYISRPRAWQAYLSYMGSGPKLRKTVFFEQMAAFPGVRWNEVSRRYEGIVLNEEAMIRLGEGS